MGPPRCPGSWTPITHCLVAVSQNGGDLRHYFGLHMITVFIYDKGSVITNHIFSWIIFKDSISVTAETRWVCTTKTAAFMLFREIIAFYSQWRNHWNFSLTYSFWPRYGPGVDSASNRNEYREYFMAEKAACRQVWQPYHLHVRIVWKSGSLSLLESLGRGPGMYRGSFTFFPVPWERINALCG
jgi:hypothetical protein